MTLPARPVGRPVDLGRHVSDRARRGLQRAGLGRLDDLLALTRRELLRRPGIGLVLAREIEEALAEQGLYLRKDPYRATPGY